ncbi:hypothetical protein [Bdellovibrio sp. HCB337]|uniref:hypothetical protein n=1 Tax=Bdellovibrio sp. HCB337 TaxID=3394358 RepID=UPI0039A72D3A
MMTKKLFQNVVLTMILLTGAVSAGAAPKVQKITIDVFPYVASLGENAARIEQVLAEKAVTICGSLDNVSHLDNVTLKMQNIRAFKVNRNGIPGGIGEEHVFDFAYPRVLGSAKVVCKN